MKKTIIIVLVLALALALAMAGCTAQTANKLNN